MTSMEAVVVSKPPSIACLECMKKREKNSPSASPPLSPSSPFSPPPPPTPVNASILWSEQRLDVVYPGYGLAAHKGYCTADHLAALLRQAACAIHRRSFRPVTALWDPGPVESDVT